MWLPKPERQPVTRTWTKIDWQPAPWWMLWRGRERRLQVESRWFYDFLTERERWEYR